MTSIKALAAAALMSVAATAVQAHVYGIATNSAGSSFYAVGTAISRVIQEKAGLTARVQPTSGGSVYLPLVNRNDMDFAIATSLDATNAYLGKQDFKGHKNSNLRLVAAVYVIPIAIGVRNDSRYKAIKDLKGVRMPTKYTAQQILLLVQNALLGTAGLSTADMKPFPVANFIRGMAALGTGQVDAATFCVGCGLAERANVALKSHGGLRFLPVANTPKSLAAMHRAYPGSYLKILKPSPGLAGIVKPTSTMVYSGYLLTNSKVPASVVYKVAKALYGNKSILEASTKYEKTFDPRLMAQTSIVPCQAGAEKFYKQVGEWPPKTP